MLVWLTEFVVLMSRVTLKQLMRIYGQAAAEAVNVCSEAYKKRWYWLADKNLNLNIGANDVAIPEHSLEPDAFPYPEALEFKTKIHVSTVDEDANIVNEGRQYPEVAQEIEVKIVFSFGAIPEGYALQKDKQNSLLSSKLDKINNE